MTTLSEDTALWLIIGGPMVVYLLVVAELATRGRGWRR